MRVKVFRGKNQIGGNLIQIVSSKAKIILDTGMDLAEDSGSDLIKELKDAFDYRQSDAVFITHYHTDHMGLAYNAHGDIPIYIGETSYKIVSAANGYRNKKTFPAAAFLKHKSAVTVGDIKVTPYLWGNAVFENFILHIECMGESILYVGDFGGKRIIERNNWEFLRQNTDLLICRGAALSKEDKSARDEKALEKKAVKLFKKIEGPVFVLLSSMNIDRIVSIYNAAQKSGRLFLQELYMAEITSAVGGDIPNPKNFEGVKGFVTRIYEDYRLELFNSYGKENSISKSGIAKTKFVMGIRASMYNYIKSLCETMNYPKGLLVYSFKSGYVPSQGVRSFLESCQNLGLKTVALHTASNADIKCVKKFLLAAKPKNIMPVNVEDKAWFGKVKSDWGLRYNII